MERTEVMGTDGKTAEFQVNGDILQWRYKGESVWLNLYDLTTLKGADGTEERTERMAKTERMVKTEPMERQ